MLGGERDELFFGRGRDDGAAPAEQGRHDNGRGLARSLDPEEQHVVFGR